MCQPDELLAVATDQHFDFETDVPLCDLTDVRSLADLIEAHFLATEPLRET